MEPVVVRGAGPADVIAYTWYELGYQPADSLVLVALFGSRNRLGAISRSDLPPRHTRRALLVEQVHSAAGPLARAGASGVMALICATTHCASRSHP